MLRETEIEEIIGHVSKFLSLVASQLGVGALGLPGYTYGFMTTGKICCHTNYKIWHNQTAKKHLL